MHNACALIAPCRPGVPETSARQRISNSPARLTAIDVGAPLDIQIHASPQARFPAAAGARSRFHPFVGDQVLVLNEVRYANPGGEGAKVDLRTDVRQMFNGANTVDMAGLSTVKFDRDDARLLADNYARMISICSSDCGP